MNGHFKINAIKLAICLAYPALGVPVMAAEPYPALPVALSTAVTPNVMLHVDNSGSMADLPPGGGSKTKMTIAKAVAKSLVTKNSTLNWGLFSFDEPNPRVAGKLLAPFGSTAATITSKIDGMTAVTGTPLGEALFEISRVFGGETSFFGKTSSAYESPIKYRCQKNFVIMVTDGVSTRDDDGDTVGPYLPGLGSKSSSGVRAAVNYTSYDALGAAVTKSFKVCKSTSTVTSITCPAKLEGSSVNNAFLGTSDDSNSYGRTVRDVAMYMFDKDFKVGGLDNDNQSYDDDKFKKQNVITYMVGFAIDDPVLEAAAIVGNGQYFTSSDETGLSNALNSVVASIINSVSNAGGVATTNPAKIAGNKLFQPVFNPEGWYGELRCYDYASITYDASGKMSGGKCTPNPLAVIPAAASRKIWSAKWAPASGQNVEGSASTWTGAFEFTTANKTTGMTAAQLANLNNSLFGTTVSDQQNVVINFVRGTDVSGTTRVRSATTGLLGDITDGQPLVVTAPSGITTDASYSAATTGFKAVNALRNIVFVGANDGMLHAFEVTNATSSKNMTELMGFVPSPVYPHLASLPSPTYGVSGGTAHVYGVNGELRQADVKLGGTWKTLVVGGLAQGGQGYFAIDATSNSTLTTSAASAVKWEWNDQHDKDVGYTFGAPLIYNVRTSPTAAVPAVILVNGYENSYDDTATGGKKSGTANTSALYIVNANTGALIKKIAVTGGAGLSSPAGVDFGQDGVLDYVYAGDINGKVWRFDLTDSSNFNVATNPIFDAGTSQPIVMRPAVKPVNDASGNSRGNLVLFGTGKLQTETDRNSTTTQSFYAVLDNLSANPTTLGTGNLLERTIDVLNPSYSAGTTNYRAGTYRAIQDLSSGTTALDLTSSTETRKGWYINFPASSERLVSSPLLLDYMVIFGTGVPASSQKCLPGGTGWVMGLDPMTGGVTVSSAKKAFSFVDVKTDGKSSVDDKLTFSTGAAYASGFSVEGIPTELTYVANQSKIITISSSSTGLGSAGNAIALQDANAMAVYTGNAATGVGKGDAMGRPGPDPTKGGELVVCGIGGVKCEKNTINPPAASGAYKIETTIWREIK